MKNPHDTLLIRAENERLLDGEKCITCPLDNHTEHIESHKELLLANKNSDQVRVILDHIQEHIDELKPGSVYNKLQEALGANNELD